MKVNALFVTLMNYIILLKEFSVW